MARCCVQAHIEPFARMTLKQCIGYGVASIDVVYVRQGDINRSAMNNRRSRSCVPGFERHPNKDGTAKLAARPKPYYRQLGPGRTLGYIRRNGAAGAWIVRARTAGRYRTRILGHADDLTQPDGRDVLAYQALRMVTNPRALAPGGKMTVARALDDYFAALAARSKHADEYKAAAAKKPRMSASSAMMMR